MSVATEAFWCFLNCAEVDNAGLRKVWGRPWKHMGMIQSDVCLSLEVHETG